MLGEKERRDIQDLKRERDALKEDHAKMKAALEFYGDKSRWHLHYKGGSFQAIDFADSYMGRDQGSDARATLANLEWKSE